MATGRSSGRCGGGPFFFFFFFLGGVFGMGFHMFSYVFMFFFQNKVLSKRVFLVGLYSLLGLFNTFDFL